MDGQILSMKFATYGKAGRRSGNPVFVKTRFPDPPAKTFIIAGGRVNRVFNLGQSRVQRGILACRFAVFSRTGILPVLSCANRVAVFPVATRLPAGRTDQAAVAVGALLAAPSYALPGKIAVNSRGVVPSNRRNSLNIMSAEFDVHTSFFSAFSVSSAVNSPYQGQIHRPPPGYRQTRRMYATQPYLSRATLVVS